jgi:hypothetical protein
MKIKPEKHPRAAKVNGHDLGFNFRAEIVHGKQQGSRCIRTNSDLML